jgi:hypothetical protein
MVRIRFGLLLFSLVVIGFILYRLASPVRVADLSLNLFAEIAGILITIGYVELVVRRIQRDQWKSTDELIKYDLLKWIQRFMNLVEVFLKKGGWHPNLAHPGLFVELEKLSREELYSAFRNQVLSDAFDSFKVDVQQKRQDLSQMIAIYSHRLPAEDLNLLLGLQKSLRRLDDALNTQPDEATMAEWVNHDEVDFEEHEVDFLAQPAFILQDAIDLSIQAFWELSPLKKD